MLKFAVQSSGGSGSSSPVSSPGADGPSVQAHIHPRSTGSNPKDSNNNDTHKDHAKSPDSEKKGDCQDCAICTARRLVISQEKSLVRRARSRSRERLQHKRLHDANKDSSSTSCSDQSTDHEPVSDSSTDAPTVIERTQNGRKLEKRDSNHSNHTVKNSASENKSAQTKTREHTRMRSRGSWRSMERLSDDTSTTSSSDLDSLLVKSAKRSRSTSRGRKRTTSPDSAIGANSPTNSGDEKGRSRSNSRGRKKSTASIENVKLTDLISYSDSERKGGLGQSRKPRLGRRSILTRQTMVASDTELLAKNSGSESDVGNYSPAINAARLDLRRISNAQSKYREKCRADISSKRRGSASAGNANVNASQWRKFPKAAVSHDIASSEESRRLSDTTETMRIRPGSSTPRKTSLPVTDSNGMMCAASYSMPRVNCVVRKATVRKCRSEQDGFMSDGNKSSSGNSDCESTTSSGRMSTTSDLDLPTEKVIFECDEDAASCISIDGSCVSDKSSTSDRSIPSNSISQATLSSDEMLVGPISPREDSTSTMAENVCSRSPSGNVSCNVLCSDSSGVSCFDGISPIASQTKTAVIKTGEKTVARVRRLNNKTRRSSAGSLPTRRDTGSHFRKEDDSSHLNGKELEMLIVGSCFGSSKCFESHDTSDYESEGGCESHSESDSQSKERRSSIDDSESDAPPPPPVIIPCNAVASRLAGNGHSYSPVKASRDRVISELAKMPKADFSHRATMQHPHHALSPVELSLKEGEAIYLHRKELEILKEQSPIWVMAYSKSLKRIGFVPAVYVNIRLEDLV